MFMICVSSGPIGRRADIVRRTDRPYRTPGLRFSQDPNYLFFAESTSLSCSAPSLKQNFTYVTSPFWGSGQGQMALVTRLLSLEASQGRCAFVALSKASNSTVAKLVATSLMAYGITTNSLWIIPPHEYTTFRT